MYIRLYTYAIIILYLRTSSFVSYTYTYILCVCFFSITTFASGYEFHRRSSSSSSSSSSSTTWQVRRVAWNEVALRLSFVRERGRAPWRSHTRRRSAEAEGELRPAGFGGGERRCAAPDKYASCDIMCDNNDNNNSNKQTGVRAEPTNNGRSAAHTRWSVRDDRPKLVVAFAAAFRCVLF